MNNSTIKNLWLFMAIGLLISSISTFIVTPEFIKLNYITLILSFISFIGLFITNRKTINETIRRSYFKNAISNLITVFFVLSIVFILNYIAFKNNFFIDMTKDKLYSLSSQSVQVLGKVDKKMNMTLFARRGDWDHYLSFVNKYRILNKNVVITAIDIDTEPAKVELFNIKKSGTLIIEYEGIKVTVNSLSELNVTNQIIKLLRNKNINIYYSIGHGEADPMSKEQKGVKFLFQKIKDSNYSLLPIDLLKVKNIPSNADGVIILGPKKGFLDIEINTLEKYLLKGGDLFVSLGPEMSDKKLSNLYALIKGFGIEFVNSIVVDRLATVQGSNATIPIITDYNNHHSITKTFSGRTLMPLSSALISSVNKDITYTSLLRTSKFPASWAETNIKDVTTGKAVYGDDDLKGPIDLISSTYHQKYNSKLIVSGSSSFFINGYETQSNNFNLFLNMISWLVDDEGIISLNRPGLSNERIFISVSQEMLILFFLMICSPTFFFGISIYVYRRRLNK
jgi:ABC-2 type transport system permease protein